MHPLSKAACQARQPERRDARIDQRALTNADRRGYADRRADAEWRHSWLRSRVVQSLRD